MTLLSERRKQFRFPTDTPIMFSYLNENPYSYYGAMMKNHSQDGACFFSNYAPATGAVLSINRTNYRLVSAISDRGNVEYLQIVWCERNPTDGDFAYRIGARCTDSPPIIEAEDDPFTGLTATVERAAAGNDVKKIQSAFEHAKQIAESRERNLATLNRFARAVTSTLDLQKILEIICEEMVRIFKARNAGIGLLNIEKTKLKLVAFHTMSETEIDATGLEIPVDGNAATIHVISSAQTIIVPDAQNNPITASFHDIASLRGTHCIMIVPLIARSEVIGTIGLPTSDDQYVYTPSDVSLAQTIASQISGVLENARLYEETEKAKDAAEAELEIGRQIQVGFLPDRLPVIPGWEISAHFQPARRVAGDFYDVIPLGENKLIALIIADVCGKGVGAALFMGLFRTLLRASTLEKFGPVVSSGTVPLDSFGDIMAQIIDHMNNYIAMTHNKPNMFATVFYGILNPDTGDLTYINCGHPKPLIIRQNTIKEELNTSGPVVGILPNVQFKPDRIRMAHGDLLFACTDGISEAENESSEFFGADRLLSLLTQPYSSAEQMISAVSIDVNYHILQTVQFDDVTMLAVRREKQTEEGV